LTYPSWAAGARRLDLPHVDHVAYDDIASLFRLP